MAFTSLNNLSHRALRIFIHLCALSSSLLTCRHAQVLIYGPGMPVFPF